MKTFILGLIFGVLAVVVGLCAWAGAHRQAALASAAINAEAMNEWVMNLYSAGRKVSFGKPLRIMLLRPCQIKIFP